MRRKIKATRTDFEAELLAQLGRPISASAYEQVYQLYLKDKTEYDPVAYIAKHKRSWHFLPPFHKLEEGKFFKGGINREPPSGPRPEPPKGQGGYQPTSTLTSPPPQGGSGVPPTCNCTMSCNGDKTTKCKRVIQNCPLYHGYVQVIPNSHFFTNIEQIISCLELVGKAGWVTPQYLITGLKNTIKEGYKLTKKRK